MKDFAIDPDGNKFTRDKNGPRLTRSYLEYMAQKTRCAVSLFLGEWYLDKNIGIPYIPAESDKSARRSVLETALITAISAIKGIKSLLSFETIYNKNMRVLRVRFAAKCENDEVLEYNEELPVRRGSE